MQKNDDIPNYRLSDYEFAGFKVINDGEFNFLRLVIGKQLEKGSLVFALDNNYFDKAICDVNVTSLICTNEVLKEKNLSLLKAGVAVSENPKLAFYRLHNLLAKSEVYMGRRRNETIIGKETKISDYAIISPTDVVIGDKCIIEENVIIRPGVVIGNNVHICAGAVLGAQSEFTARDEDGNLFHIESVGTVRIGNNVNIGCLAVINRGCMTGEETVIHDNVFFGERVSVEHNVEIFENSEIYAGSQICGYTVIGKNVHIAPQSIVSNKLKIGDGCYITLGSVVMNSLKPNTNVAGNFAIEKEKFMKNHLKKLL